MEFITFTYFETETCRLKNVCLKVEKYSSFAALLLMTVKEPKQILPLKLFSVANLSLGNKFYLS
jgi:hypothetical protein